MAINQTAAFCSETGGGRKGGMRRFRQLSEAEARRLIQIGEAGYWELSLRDSLGAKPIAHPVQTCVFLGEQWYLIPVAYFEVKALGRIGNEAMSADAKMIQVNDDILEVAIREEMAKKGKSLAQ